MLVDLGAEYEGGDPLLETKRSIDDGGKENAAFAFPVRKFGTVFTKRLTWMNLDEGAKSASYQTNSSTVGKKYKNLIRPSSVKIIFQSHVYS